MLEVTKLILNKVAPFENVTVNFKKASPITYIRGINRDSDKARPESNGAGKTMLVSGISNVAYFSAPSSIKKRSKKDMVSRSGSFIQMNVKANDGKEYKIKQYPSKYDIGIVDGGKVRDLKVATATKAESMIKNDIWTLPESSFYTYCFLTTRKVFSLQDDTDVNRMHLLTDVFSLDQYNELYDFFMVKLRSIKDSELKLSTVVQNKTRISEQLKKAKDALKEKIDVDLLQGKKLQLEKSVKSHERTFSDLSSTLDALNTLIDIEEKLDTLRKKWPYPTHPNKSLKILKANLKKAIAYENYQSELKQYSARVSELKSQLSDIGEIDSSELDDAKNLIKRYEAAKEHIEDNERAYSKYVSYKEDLEEIRKKLKELRKPSIAFAELDEELASTKTTIGLKKLLQHQHKNGVECPLCMSKFDADNLRKLIASAEKKLVVLNEANLYYETLEKYKKLDKACSNIDIDISRYDRAREFVNSYKDKVQKAVELESKLKQYSAIRAKIDSIEKPDEVEPVDYDADVLRKHIELANTILLNIDYKNKCLNKYRLKDIRSRSEVQRTISKLSKERNLSKKSLDTDQDELSKLLTMLDSYALYSTEINLYAKELDELSNQEDSLQRSIRKKKIYENLALAYSKKGLKASALDDVCHLFEQNLNQYRSLVFKEPFEFIVGSSHKGVSIVVDRGNGKISDVRQLSNGESNAFRALCLISLIPLLPNHRRTNFVILDEPTAHMSQGNKQLFYTSYLPVLSEIVPRVFIISPIDDEFIGGSGVSEWTVVKEHGISKLITNGE